MAETKQNYSPITIEVFTLTLYAGVENKGPFLIYPNPNYEVYKSSLKVNLLDLDLKKTPSKF